MNSFMWFEQDILNWYTEYREVYEHPGPYMKQLWEKKQKEDVSLIGDLFDGIVPARKFDWNDSDDSDDDWTYETVTRLFGPKAEEMIDYE